MFINSVKSILAVAVVASGAAFSTTSANAGGQIGIYIGSGHGNGIYYNNKRRHGAYHAPRRHRACNPRRALNKAYRMGLNRPFVARVNHKRIVIKGHAYGYPGKVVFKRHSKNCRVLKTRGL